MTEESNSDIDWTQMEQLANGVSASDVEESEGWHITTLLTEEMINKRMVWDMSPHSHVDRISAYLGLPVASEEGMDKEHDEAHERTAEVVMLTPSIHMLAQSAASAVVANMVVMSDNEDEVPLDGFDYAEQVERIAVVVFNSAQAIIAELADWGLIHTPQFIIQEVQEDGDGE